MQRMTAYQRIKGTLITNMRGMNMRISHRGCDLSKEETFLRILMQAGCLRVGVSL